MIPSNRINLDFTPVRLGLTVLTGFSSVLRADEKILHTLHIIWIHLHSEEVYLVEEKPQPFFALPPTKILFTTLITKV